METEARTIGKFIGYWRTLPAVAVLCGAQLGFGIASLSRAAETDDASAKAVQRALAYLAARQHENGSYGVDAHRGHVAATAWVGRAMMAARSKPGEGPYGRELSKCLDYLLGRVQADGFIISEDKQEPAPMYGHAFALAFIADCQRATPTDDIKQKLQRAVELSVKSQNKEGGWRYLPKPEDADLSVTVTQLIALLAAREAGADVPKEAIGRAIGYIKQSQNADGGFRYVLVGGTSGFARSAAAVAALYRAGEGDSDSVRKGLAYVAKFPAAETVGQPEVFYFYGHYYAARVMNHAGADQWEPWAAAVKEKLLAQQSKDGSWPDTASVDLGTAMACLTLQTHVAR